jgi:hypothetical protein
MIVFEVPKKYNRIDNKINDSLSKKYFFWTSHSDSQYLSIKNTVLYDTINLL